MEAKRLPGLYICGQIRELEGIISKYGLSPAVYAKGEVLTKAGTINNTAHFIKRGIMQLSLLNAQGNIKSMTLFGPRTVFPIGVVPHENYQDYEMVLTAFTELEVCSVSYPMLRRICEENGGVAAQILEENCEFVGYLFYWMMNNTYGTLERRIADILYLYAHNFYQQDHLIPMTQSELLNITGGSHAQVERCIKKLKMEKIIEVAYGKIQIVDIDRLLPLCSEYITDLD